MSASPHAAFVAGLPKAELHVHHVGSASMRIVTELAERHPGTVPSDPERLRAGFVAGLPKAELHVHHVGSASPRMVSELAARHPGTVPSDLEELRQFFEFRDFAHFIEVYLAVVDLVKTPEDIRFLTYEVGREMAEAQSIRYAELT